MPHVSAAARRRERARRHHADYGVQTACAEPGRGHRKEAKRAREGGRFYEGHALSGKSRAPRNVGIPGFLQLHRVNTCSAIYL